MQGFADGNELCISDEIMRATGVGELVEAFPRAAEYVPVRGVDEQIEIHRIPIE